MKVMYQCDECGRIVELNYRPGMYFKCICGFTDYLHDEELDAKPLVSNEDQKFLKELNAYEPEERTDWYECDECGNAWEVTWHSGKPIVCARCGHTIRAVAEGEAPPERKESGSIRCQSCPFDYLVCQTCTYSVPWDQVNVMEERVVSERKSKLWAFLDSVVEDSEWKSAEDF